MVLLRLDYRLTTRFTAQTNRQYKPKHNPRRHREGFWYTYDMKPLKNLIVIEIVKPTQKVTVGGLVMPTDKWGERQDLAEIIALPALLPMNLDLKVGDKVVINPYAIIDTPHATQKLIKESDILALWVE